MTAEARTIREVLLGSLHFKLKLRMKDSALGRAGKSLQGRVVQTGGKECTLLEKQKEGQVTSMGLAYKEVN